MNVLKIFLTAISLCCFCIVATGQVSTAKIKDKANLYFKNEKYFEALQFYQEYDKRKNDDEDVKLRLGICYYFNNNLKKSIDYLSSVNYNQKKSNSIAHFYLGCAYHSNHEFKKAIKEYKLFLKASSSNDPNRRAVKDEIKRCASALKVIYQNEIAVVENLGDKVNTRFDEFGPVQSPTVEGKLYFSSSRNGNLGGLRDEKGLLDDLSGKYSSDIFSAIIQNGEWTNPKRLHNLLNSPKNDVILDFNEAGNAMILFKGFDFFSGQILIDSFKPIEEKPLYPPKFNSPVVAERGDASPCFFNDSTLVFSSRISGGYGGSDLYISQRVKGKWMAPQNLGSQINSSYDETTPFLAKDGRTLYFSSNKISGVGGLDIYKAVYDDFKKEWSVPMNLGFPINSPKDDNFFRLNRDGSKGYFSSSRTEGYGQKDLYVAYFKSQNMEQLIVSNPAGFHSLAFDDPFDQDIIDYGNSNPDLAFRGEIMEYEIQPIYYESDKDILNPTNTAQLNDIISMMKEYPQLKIEITGNSDNQDQSQFSLLFSIKRAEAVAKYFTENGVKASNILLKGCGSNFPIAKNKFGGEPNPLGQRLNRRIDLKMLNSRVVPVNFSFSKPVVEKAMIASKGRFFNNSIKGLSYKVQVAEIKQNYNSKLITEYPDAMVESAADTPYYSYTLGLYQTFDSAELLRKDLQRQGIATAKIIPYINGFRLDEREFKSLSDSYPDLLNFMDSASKD